MYERNINVLEMFVEKKLGYVETNNIKNNYFDYKDFVKVLADYINIRTEEIEAKKQYALAVQNIQNIQNTKEKLYNQNVKFEYSRNMLFNDVNRKIEDIEKCLVKIESALEKNKNTFLDLRKSFIQGIIDLNDKHRKYKKISKPKNKIEAEFKEALSLLKENYHSINLDDIELTKKFIENPEIFEEELVEKLMRNGKNEKVPFDQNAIIAASKLGLDIAQKEAENYLFMYEQTGKILNELETNKLKIEARKKHITDTEVKLSFLDTEKEYLVQFLDNERVTAIQGQSEHERLMKNCCSILKEDVAQINILYDLIIKETKKRATNRCYEELYNKSYLENIEAKERKFIEKTTNLNYANGTIISPNYWRIDSIKAIYANFDKNVYETYGRKFVAPDEELSDSTQQPQIIERVVERIVEKPVEKIVEKIIEKPVEKQPENPVDKLVKKLEKPIQKTTQDNNQIETKKQAQVDTQQETTEKKTLPKLKRVQLKNQIIENNKELEKNIVNQDELQEQSMYEISQIENDDIELDDIEDIIKQAEQSLTDVPQKTKKSSLIKKIVKQNKGKYAED